MRPNQMQEAHAKQSVSFKTINSGFSPAAVGVFLKATFC
jgi:hypothetical protein